MKSKLTIGISLTLIGIIGVTLAACCYFLAFINQGLFVGFTLFTWISFLAGIMLLNDKMSNPTKH